MEIAKFIGLDLKVVGFPGHVLVKYNEEMILDPFYDGRLLDIDDLQEILDCTDQKLAEWQNKNPDIDLTSYFCSNCATDTIKDIEGLERNGGFSSPEHLESYHEKK